MWASKKYSNNQYNKAGKAIADEIINISSKDSSYELLNNWRAIHAFPLHEISQSLRAKALSIGLEGNLVQRTKRLSSIIPKLSKYGLTQIQDIAGCRMILQRVRDVEKLCEHLLNSNLPYELFSKDDYIERPKDSGYRGLHLVYKYKGVVPSEYDGLKVEIQLRSTLQHAWATSVEIIDAFTNQSLKASKGNADWERFFALMSSYVALAEICPPVPNTPHEVEDIVKELKEYEKKLNVNKLLLGIEKSLEVDSKLNLAPNLYYLIELKPKRYFYPIDYSTEVFPYEENEYHIAVEHYLRAEKRLQGSLGNVVLVSANSVKSLRDAYPNYFSDATYFRMLLNAATESDF